MFVVNIIILLLIIVLYMFVVILLYLLWGPSSIETLSNGLYNLIVNLQLDNDHSQAF